MYPAPGVRGLFDTEIEIRNSSDDELPTPPESERDYVEDEFPSDLSRPGQIQSRLALIVRTEDIDSVGANKVIEAIKALDTNILKIQNEQKGIAEKLWWRKFPGDIAKILGGWGAKINQDITDLHSYMGELSNNWKQVHVIQENQFIPSNFKNLQYLMISLFLQQKNSEHIRETVKSRKFGEAVIWYKKVVSECVMAANTVSGGVTSLINSFDENIKPIDLECLSNIKYPWVVARIKKIWLDAFEIFRQAMNQLNTKAAGEVAQNSDKWTIMQDALTATKDQSLMKKVIDSLPLKLPKKAVSSNDMIQIRAKGVLCGSFYMESAETGSNLAWFVGYDKEAWRVISLMQDNVAKGILGLREEIEECLKNLVTDYVEKAFTENERKDAIIKYYSICDQLEDDLEKQKVDLFSQELTNRSKEAVDYAAGLSKAIEDLRSLVKVLEDFYTRGADLEQIFQTEKCLFNYLSLNEKALNAIEGTLRAIQAFNFASAGFEAIVTTVNPKKNILSKEPETSDIVTSFMDITTETIKNTLAEKWRLVSPFTVDEQKVGPAIMGKQSLANLFYTGEDIDGLPALVRSYLERRITKLMYFSDEKYDQELAVLIYILTTDERYTKQWTYSLKKHEEFKDVIKSYFTSEKNITNTDESLKDIRDVLYFIYKALQKDERDPIFYGRALQSLFDFYTDHANESSEEINSFIKIVYDKLSVAVAEHQYVKIPSKKGFFIRESFLFDMKKLSSFQIEEKPVWSDIEGLFYRALGCSIWGKNQEERLAAEEIIKGLLTSKVMPESIDQQYGQAVEDIKKMICENAIRKICQGNLDIGKEEKKILIKGPITTYLETGTLELHDPRILFVLVHLMKAKDKDILRVMIEIMGKDKVIEWQENVAQCFGGIGNEENQNSIRVQKDPKNKEPL